MAIQVKLFASLRERAGWSERLVAADGLPATPRSLWRQLQLSDGAEAGTGRAGQADALPQGIRVAINQAFAAPDTPLVDGDELAFLPPISGG
jgi:molybdopterin synthase sulfur carrier subunit